MIDKFKTAWNELKPEDQRAIKNIGLFGLVGYIFIDVLYHIFS